MEVSADNTSSSSLSAATVSAAALVEVLSSHVGMRQKYSRLLPDPTGGGGDKSQHHNRRRRDNDDNDARLVPNAEMNRIQAAYQQDVVDSESTASASKSKRRRR